MTDTNRATPWWHMQAACRQLGSPEIFFPTPTVEKTNGLGDAKPYCEACPVMYECLKAAFDGNEYGTWGGLTQSERTKLRQKIKPEDFATVERLREVLEDELPRCTECGNHRKEKWGGYCATCFRDAPAELKAEYAEHRAEQKARESLAEAA
jgi:hypothetical protein